MQERTRLSASRPTILWCLLQWRDQAGTKKTIEATMNPRTNFGKRSHITPALTFCPPAAPFLTVHHIERRNAATPIKTFCENLTMTPVFIAGSLIRAPAATTEPLVSRVPPSHAPPTSSGIPGSSQSMAL